MKKKSFLVAMVALISVASVCIPSLAILIPREESDRDPTSGYDPPPGESFSYAYQYGEFDPQTQKYYNIHSYSDWGWEPSSGTYDPDWARSRNPDGPWIQTRVWYWYDGE